MTLYVRRLERKDLPRRVEWFNHEEVRRHMILRPPITMASTEAWFDGLSGSDDRIDIVFEDLTLPHRDVVGMAGFVDISKQDQRGEFYVLVGPEYVGRGIGKGITRWLCDFGFYVLHLHRIHIHVTVGNDRAFGLYRSLGFTHEGTLREHQFYDDRRIDRHVMGLLHDEWQRTTESISIPGFISDGPGVREIPDV
jgi:diamine N-acetyltransferase